MGCRFGVLAHRRIAIATYLCNVTQSVVGIGSRQQLDAAIQRSLRAAVVANLFTGETLLQMVVKEIVIQRDSSVVVAKCAAPIPTFCFHVTKKGMKVPFIGFNTDSSPGQ